MIGTKKVIVVMPAYNAARTLERTYREVPISVVDEVILVDDSSNDETADLAKRIGIEHVIIHEGNKGYGANQKTCYNKALALGADIVVMLHPDYQYTQKLIPSMCNLRAAGIYPVVLGSRILGNGALEGGMPRYKYVANRLLTAFQNLLLGEKLSEYHTGFRAYSREVLQRINFEKNSDDFIFDNQVISQIFMAGYSIAEITCPTKYFKEASSINVKRSVKYGIGVIGTSILHVLHRSSIINAALYETERNSENTNDSGLKKSNNNGPYPE